MRDFHLPRLESNASMIDESNRCMHHHCIDWYIEVLVNVLIYMHWLVHVYMELFMHHHNHLLYNTTHNNVRPILPTRLPSPKQLPTQKSSQPLNIPNHPTPPTTKRHYNLLTSLRIHLCLPLRHPLPLLCCPNTRLPWLSPSPQIMSNRTGVI